MRSLVLWTALLALVAVWAVYLRPQVLGGPTAIVVVSGTSMEPKLHTRDLVLVRRQGSYRVGDVVAYRIPEGDVGKGRVVIHRIIGGSARAGYVLRGDNRDTPDLWRPKPADVTGRKWASASAQGRVRAVVLSPLGVATLAGLAAFLLVTTDGRKRQPRLT